MSAGPKEVTSTSPQGRHDDDSSHFVARFFSCPSRARTRLKSSCLDLGTSLGAVFVFEEDLWPLPRVGDSDGPCISPYLLSLAPWSLAVRSRTRKRWLSRATRSFTESFSGDHLEPRQARKTGNDKTRQGFRYGQNR